MVEDKENHCWVVDQLIDLLGYNNPTTVAFVIGLAKKTRAPGDLISQLEGFGFPASQDTETFARELQRRFPNKSTGLSAYRKAEKEAAVLVKKQQQYQLLDADDVEDEGALRAAAEKRQKNDKEEELKHKRHLRRKRKEDVDEDEEVVNIKRGQSRRVEAESYEDEETERERARKQDQREEQLEERLREKDAASTKEVGEFKLSKKQEVEARRRSEAQERKELLPSLRQVSREEYLKRREAKKLQELEDELIDGELLFGGMKLTANEQTEYRYKKKMYELAKQRAQDMDDAVGYHMPEAYDKEDGVRQDKRFAVALERNRDVKGQMRANNRVEQEAWEKLR